MCMCTDIKKTIQNKLLVPIFKHEIQVFMACTLTGVSVKGASIRNVFRYQNVKYNLKGFLQAYPVQAYNFHVHFISMHVQQLTAIGQKVSIQLFNLFVYC